MRMGKALIITVTFAIYSFLLRSISPHLNTGCAQSTRCQWSFTKQSHRQHDPRQMERLARRGAEGNLRKLCDSEPSEAILVRQAGGGAAHFERVVVVGNGVADLADSHADLGGGEVFGRGQIPE